MLEAVAASGIKVQAKAMGSSYRPSSFFNIPEPHYSHPSHPVIHLLLNLVNSIDAGHPTCCLEKSRSMQ